MNIEQIIEFCKPEISSGIKPAKTGKLCQDSREVASGDIFIAVKGHKSDGHNFIREAIARGASVVITENGVTEIDIDNVLFLQVKNTRNLLGPLAQLIAGNPAQNLTIIGVTGTNGKTTVSTLIWQILTKLGLKASLLGTVEKRINQEIFKSSLTTADPIELSYDMKQMVEAGSKFLVMEVSSHALSQERVRGIPFRVAVFTNLSHDHLDYHESMNEYASAKKKLFSSLDNKSWAVTNLDDSRGEWMINSTPANILSFSFHSKGLFKASIITSGVEGSVIELDGIKIKTPLAGLFNAYNVIEALLGCTALGLDGKHVAEILTLCNGAPGRMERVNPASRTGKEPLVFVDYAHTPNALENVATTLCDLKNPDQKLMIIFGCGGDRDKTKRPIMAEIAEKYADKVIVTSDNPRTEDPDIIIDEIMSGFKNRKPVIRITSRQKAITETLISADKNSIVLIAGKGHETYQEINGIRTHFDDREVALDGLKKWKMQNKEGVS
jgi:UDP-N-acetylmuramoyl-L-alanyl-D-glutamate--2,6-diaminopimelate ligase